MLEQGAQKPCHSLPEALSEGASRPLREVDLARPRQIRVERALQTMAYGLVEDRQVAFAVEHERSEIEVRRAHDRGKTIDDHGLGVQDRGLVFEDSHAAAEEPGVGAAGREPQQVDVALAGKEQPDVDAAPGGSAERA